MGFNCSTCNRKFYTGIPCTREDCPVKPARDECSIKPDHYTFPDDPEKEARPGYMFLKFDWLIKLGILPAGFVAWHDKVTTVCSMAQRLGITNRQINYYTEIQLRNHGWTARRIGEFLVQVNHLFYEGRLA